MSITLSTITDQVKNAEKESEKSKKLLSSKVKPFQMFCRTVSGKTITIDDMTPTTPVQTLMEKIQDKDGIPPKEQVLIYAGKVLDPKRAIGMYGIGRESTVHCSLRLRGGYGEREAMDYVVSLHMRRGNVGPDVLETEGRSYAMKAFGRELKKDRAFQAKIRKKLGMEDDEHAWTRWWAKNRLHVSALIQETTHSGNCGDFAQVVSSRLVSETEGQYVYQIVMTGSCAGPGTNPDCTFDEAHTFDHQLCVTYPMVDDKNNVTRNDQQMRALKLNQMDPEVATVADGWHNHRIISFADWKSAPTPSDPFPKKGGNCYHKVGFANLKIVSIDPCGKTRLTKKERSDIASLVEEEIEGHKDSDKCTFDRFSAVWNAGFDPDGPSALKQAKQLATQAKLIGGTTGKTWDDLLEVFDREFDVKVEKWKKAFKSYYEGYATADDQDDYLLKLKARMIKWKWKDPKRQDFLDAVEQQTGLTSAAHALCGATTGLDYFQNHSNGLPTFGMDPMGDMIDERDQSDIRTQFVTIPADNWTLFTREALALSDEQLREYFMHSRENRDRALTPKKVRAKVFDYLIKLGGVKRMQALAHLEEGILDFVLYKDGAGAAKVLGTAAAARLYAYLNVSTDTAKVREISKLMSDEQFLHWVESSSEAARRMSRIGSVADRYNTAVTGLSDSNCKAALERLTAQGRLAVVKADMALRQKILKSTTLRAAFFTWNFHEDPSLGRNLHLKYLELLTEGQTEALYQAHPDLRD